MEKYHDDSQSLQNWENAVDPFEEAINLEEDASDKIFIKCKIYKNKTKRQVRNIFNNAENSVG